MSSIKKKLLEMVPQLRRYAYGLTGGVDKGDDLLQDSIVKILSMNKNMNYIEKLLKNHFNGKEDNSKKIWNLYVLNIWTEKNLKN